MKTNRLTQREFNDALFKREVFLYCDYEQACLRISAGTDGKLISFTKLKGKEEFETNPKSGILAQVLLEPIEIRAIDYYNF